MEDHKAILAAKQGDLATLEQLHIDGILGQNITDDVGAGLVHHASRAGRMECLKFLMLQAKFPGNQKANNGATPAHDAAATGNLAELQWLIKVGGYSMQEQDAAGASPLHVAARFGHPEVAAWLIEAGFDPAMETWEGAVPAHYAAVRGDLACLKLLVAASGSCVNKQTQSGATPLYFACQEGHLHLVQFLVKDCGADVHLRTHDGMLGLHAAAFCGHYAVVVWLVTFTDLNTVAQNEDGATALHFAAREGHAPIVERLLFMGAEIILDHRRRTPLHDAAENGHLQVCQILISHQMDPRIRNLYGCTARDLAEYNGHRKCVCYLQEVEKQTQQQSRPLQSTISLTSTMQREVKTLQKISTSETAVMAEPIESNETAISELNKSQKKAKNVAWFSNSDEKTAMPDTIISNPTLPTLDELGMSDIDALVPTHDDQGVSIPEWKRQVMVRRLQAQLASEEEMGRKNKGSCTLGVNHWQFSQAHNAILGPYGELLTKDDLLYLEKQIENLQVKKKCQGNVSELESLTEELQAVLPTTMASVTVRCQTLQQLSEDESQELPSCCNHVNGIIKSMSLLLTNFNAVKKEEDCESPSLKVSCKPSKTRDFSGDAAKREILECGVSVRNLRGNFEKKVVLGQSKPFEPQGLKAMPWEHKTGLESSPQMLSGVYEGKRQLTSKGDLLENPRDSDLSSEEASPDISCSQASAVDSCSLQKERIVLLFLSHWKKSAYAESLKCLAKKALQSQQPGNASFADVVEEVKKQQASDQKPLMEMSKLGHLVQQRYAIRSLINHWRNLISLVPSQQIRCFSHQHSIYSPEQFVPYVNGEPVDYNSLTLDLFMLGYFHILELDLPPEERKARHLLCFEVFDHLGRYRWETVRAFHKAVMDDIAAGKRSWKDSFDDIKTQFFGNNKDLTKNTESGKSPIGTYVKLVSRLRVPNMTLQEEGQDQAKSIEPNSFSNEEICEYIDRSFAFWKEKEAEIFKSEGSESLHEQLSFVNRNV